MRYGIIILCATVFLVYNTYTDNKISKYVKHNTKYLKMLGIMFSGLSLYMFLNKHPNESENMIKHAVGAVRYLPIDKSSKDLITPLFNLTSQSQIQTNQNNVLRPTRIQQNCKRSVSETKKKYVASSQNWKCDHCHNQLDATFEVDHVIELQNGGSNETSNLVALCRNCHGKKSMLQRL